MENPIPKKIAELDYRLLKESEVQKLIMRYLTRRTRIYKNAVGTAKQGDRVISFGLCKGSSDLIGFTEVKITTEMVGDTVAIFTAIEVKKYNGDPSPDQVKFIELVKSSGGIGGIAKTIDEANQIIENYTQKKENEDK